MFGPASQTRQEGEENKQPGSGTRAAGGAADGGRVLWREASLGAVESVTVDRDSLLELSALPTRPEE